MAYSNKELIDELVGLGYLKIPVVIDAFKNIDRKEFVPEELADYAYHNEPLPIGQGQTISQPLTVAFMLELLDAKPGNKILDVGAGSGWQTSLIAYLVSDARIDADKSTLINADNNIGDNQRENQFKSASVFAVERIPELKNSAEQNISKFGFIEKGMVKIILGDGSKGYQEGAPYDRIISAATAESIPDVWKDQLVIGGKIVAPVKDSIVVLDKTGKNEFQKKTFSGFSFVPLISD